MVLILYVPYCQRFAPEMDHGQQKEWQNSVSRVCEPYTIYIRSWPHWLGLYIILYTTVYIQSTESISSERLEELEECLTPSSQCFINKKKSCESSQRTPIKRKNLGRILFKPFLLFSFFSYHFYLSKKNRKNLFLCGQKFLAVEQKIPL